ncbi:uncharacterized protein [Primulina eburnea]|uniref:uncharacterized protein n=1 Tax=Primulina eburnea TaxID=1245227 RepID=UPI003C6BF58C
MCDASDTAVGAVLGQRQNKVFHTIYYTKIKDKKDVENVVVDHLSRLELISDDCVDQAINDWFPDEQLFEFVHKKYILVAVDYVSKWVEAKAYASNDAQVVLKFLKKNIFNRCHTQDLYPLSPPNEWSSGSVEPRDKSDFGESCRCQSERMVKLEHRAYWATKALNFKFTDAGERRLLQLDQLEEFRNLAYDLALSYKEKTKKAHDKRIIEREFKEGDNALLYNSRLRLFPGKLKSRWSGPFVISKIYPWGAVELHDGKCGKFTELQSILKSSARWNNLLRETRIFITLVISSVHTPSPSPLPWLPRNNETQKGLLETINDVSVRLERLKQSKIA